MSFEYLTDPERGARTPPWLLQPGDVVEVEVERLGVLRNPIVGNDLRLREA